MGPAILFCPSCTVQFLCQVTLLKTNRQKVSLSANENARHLLDPQLKGDFVRRSTHLFSSNATLKSRKNYVPFAWRVLTASMGGEVSVEEPITETGVEQDFSQDRASKGEDSLAADTSEVTQTILQRRTTLRRRRNIVVSNDALKPGATFTGVVAGIQSYGAFVNFGAFTDGLLHLSRLRTGFVESVEDAVQVGQEVRVQILDVDFAKGRISLRLDRDDGKEEEDPVRRRPRIYELDGRQKAARRGSLGRRMSGRMNERMRGRLSDPVEPATSLATSIQKGQTVTGVVKDIISTGVFVTLPEGNEGFLPASEINSSGETVMPESYFKVGQEVTVRVLGTERGRERLTMKQEVDLMKFNQSSTKDVVEVPANPFQTAFSQKEETASDLQRKKKEEEKTDGAAFTYLPFNKNEGLAAYLRRMNKRKAEEQSRLLSGEQKKTDAPSESEGGEAHAVGVAEKQFEGWINGVPMTDIIDTPRGRVFQEIEQAVKKEVVDKLQEDDLLVAMSLAAEEETVKEIVQEDGLSVALNLL